MSTAFRVVLEGTQEVPPNNSTASGLGTVIFDSTEIAASYTFRIEGVDYGPITGGPAQTPSTSDDVISTHFHNQVRGVNGPVVFGQINPAQDGDDLSIALNTDGSWTVSGRWETTDPASVPITDFADEFGTAPVGSEIPIYFNVHTNQFQGGEIRGQLIAIADDNDNVVVGTPGDDFLPGLGGNDIIRGLAGNDRLEGGDGDDIIRGGQGNDDINTGAGNDLVFGGQGNDTVGGMAGMDTVFGGAGDDFIAWNDPTGDTVFGDAGNDTLRGGDVAADTIFGGNGDDLIRAVANQQLADHAPDRLFGDRGNDTIFGGNAGDTIEGGAGDDTLAGFGGADQFIFRETERGNDTITDFDVTQDVAVLEGFGADFDPLDNLSASASGTTLDLGEGNQVLFLGLLPNELNAANFLVTA
ncbi:CHRD domain-containing protein [Bradyrhizobium sp. CSA112]|uniref:CHRD domain-containing protein n=1 Tax=Bradyrhizobium sp. CSA112 TaxID=2699170 RepID=UPI0023B0E811|nr:CHRD domain-containing protein [Bradyrhizobium sp. CSA112]MDE5455722.1 CHRD domain-containing protein [Bradyrhizobium sp. CSA112]